MNEDTSLIATEIVSGLNICLDYNNWKNNFDSKFLVDLGLMFAREKDDLEGAKLIIEKAAKLDSYNSKINFADLEKKVSKLANQRLLYRKLITEGYLLADKGLIEEANEKFIEAAKIDYPSLHNSNRGFWCQAKVNDIPQTLYRHSSYKQVEPWIGWVSNYFGPPLYRCHLVSRRLENLRKLRVLQHFILEKKDGQTVLCSSEQPNGNCDYVLFKLTPNRDYSKALQTLSYLRQGTMIDPLKE